MQHKKYYIDLPSAVQACEEVFQELLCFSPLCAEK